MEAPAVLRIIFADESDSRKLPLVTGIPSTVVELHATIKTFFQLKEEFRLQYMDTDFNAFMNLSSVSEIQNKSTVKVICTAILEPEETYVTLYPLHLPGETSSSTVPDLKKTLSSLESSCSDDTMYTSTPCSSPEVQFSGLSSWPRFFVVPKFTFEAEYELQQKNAEFETNGTTLAQS